MIQVEVKTNGTRRTMNVDTTATPSGVFEEIGVNFSNSQVNLDGRVLGTVEMGKSFAELGVTDGTVVRLNSVVKADGAAE